MFERKNTRQISVGKIKIGGGAPISIQSMTNTKTHDAAAGCDIYHRNFGGDKNV